MARLIVWFMGGGKGGIGADSSDEVDAIVDRLAEHRWAMAEITRREDEHSVLYGGFRGDVGVLRFIDTGGEWFSRGARAAPDELLYSYYQNEMEFPPDAEIPAADVRAAIQEYARTGARPTDVAWREWQAPYDPEPTIPAHDDPCWG